MDAPAVDLPRGTRVRYMGRAATVSTVGSVKAPSGDDVWLAHIQFDHPVKGNPKLDMTVLVSQCKVER